MRRAAWRATWKAVWPRQISTQVGSVQRVCTLMGLRVGPSGMEQGEVMKGAWLVGVEWGVRVCWCRIWEVDDGV